VHQVGTRHDPRVNQREDHRVEHLGVQPTAPPGAGEAARNLAARAADAHLQRTSRRPVVAGDVVDHVRRDLRLGPARRFEGAPGQAGKRCVVGDEPEAPRPRERLEPVQVEPVRRDVEAVDPRGTWIDVEQQRDIVPLQDPPDDVAVGTVRRSEADRAVGARRGDGAHVQIDARGAGVGGVRQRLRLREVHRLPGDATRGRQVASGQVRRQQTRRGRVGHDAVGGRTHEGRDEPDATVAELRVVLGEVAQPGRVVQTFAHHCADAIDQSVTLVIVVVHGGVRGHGVADEQRMRGQEQRLSDLDVPQIAFADVVPQVGVEAVRFGRAQPGPDPHAAADRVGHRRRLLDDAVTEHGGHMGEHRLPPRTVSARARSSTATAVDGAQRIPRCRTYTPSATTPGAGRPARTEWLRARTTCWRRRRVAGLAAPRGDDSNADQLRCR
jgi:hypothetical protein